MKILIVEDEPLIRKSILHLINSISKEKGIDSEITDAANGETADELLEQTNFDIVFTDIRMEDLDGLSLIQKWVFLKPHTQWVVISGYDDFQYAQQAIVMGVKDYLLKPVTKERISKTVDRLIENREINSERYIGYTETKQMLHELEEAIWVLDEELIQTLISDWAKKRLHPHLDILYYKNYLNQLIGVLVNRIKTRAHLEKLDPIFVEATEFDLAHEELYTSCLAIVKALKHKRNGNFIDPIQAAKQYIWDHIGDKLVLDDVAERMGFNATYFSHIFRQKTGQTFVDYKIKMKMEYAKKLLEQGELRIIDISNQIGYFDLPHFTKTFKKHTGFTPTEYRSKLGINA